jgi:hypothetical protein
MKSGKIINSETKLIVLLASHILGNFFQSKYRSGPEVFSSVNPLL